MKDKKSIVPSEKSLTKPNRNTLYATDDPDKHEKISAMLKKSNAMLFESIEHRCSLMDLPEVIESTKEYLVFCQEQGIMPSMRRLANWYGYSFRQLYNHINNETPTGQFLEKINDAIKDNLEQAALTNAVNNISAMFLLKSQHNYVEATKVIVEPSESLLGQPKSPEEIASYIEADIVED